MLPSCQAPQPTRYWRKLGNLTSHHQQLGGHPHWGLWGEAARRVALQAWQVNSLILMNLNSLLVLAKASVSSSNDWILRRFQDKEFVSSVLEQVRTKFTFQKERNMFVCRLTRSSLFILFLVRWTRRAWGGSSRSWAVSHTLLLAGETSEWE